MIQSCKRIFNSIRPIKEAVFLAIQFSIYFLRYKTKRAQQEKGMHMDNGSHNGGSITSPRRVAVPVLVRDGKPCTAASKDQQQVVMPPAYPPLMPGHRNWW